MRLQRQFNLIVIPLVAIPLLALGWLAYDYLLESEENKLIGSMTSDINRIQQKINIEFSKSKSNINILSSDTIVTRYALIEDEFSRYKLYQKGLLSRFKNYQQAFPLYQEVRYILPDGYEDSHWADINYNNISEEEHDSVWFPLLNDLQEKSLNIILDNPDTNKKSLYSFKPIVLRNTSTEDEQTPKSLRGYLSTTMELDWLTTELEALIKDTDSFIVLKDHKDETVFALGDAALASTNGTQQPISTGLYLMESGSDSVYVLEEKTLFGYSLSFFLRQEHAYQKADELASNILIITTISILLTLLILITLLRRSVIAPLDRLATASYDIGHGKLDSSVDLSSCDELQEISNGFNDMAQSLAQNDEKIRYIAFHDSLTQLPNRRMFQYILSNTIASTDRCNDIMALFFLDIDNFKNINDTLGHDIGDDLLVQFSQRITACLREEDSLVKPDLVDSNEHNKDLIARLGGDEFTIILQHLNAPKDAAIVAQRIINSMAEEFVIGKNSFRITTSIGITLYPDNGSTIDELVKNADIAMYHAKAIGKNNFQFYANDLNEAIASRLERETELREAIEGNQLSVYFQPQINLRNKSIYGLEALVRWHHPTKGLITPDNFIPLAEETDMILELGAWVMLESCLIAKTWLNQGILDFRVSVNVSSRQFEKQDVADLIHQCLIKSGLPSSFLTIELTESAIMSNKDENLKALDKIKKLGVTLSLDDFGTGYSSLSYLRTFPIDTLKIDRIFISETQQVDEVRVIVSAIIMMAHALNLGVVAEGVECIEELDYLDDVHCDVIQGYYFSKPLNKDATTEFIKNHCQTNLPHQAAKSQ